MVVVCVIYQPTQVTEAAAETATSHYYCDGNGFTDSVEAAAGALGLSQALGLCSRPALGRQGQTKPDFFWPWIALQTHTNIAEKMHGSHSGLTYEK